MTENANSLLSIVLDAAYDKGLKKKKNYLWIFYL